MSELTEVKRTVAGLLVLGFEGYHLSEFAAEMLRSFGLAGVILFKRNILSLDQLTELNRSILQSSERPPILSVDHEGGRVFRLPEPFTVFPSMQAVVAICRTHGGLGHMRDVGRAFGLELRSAGFNLDYAPVLDVDSNPQNPIIGDRAFGSSPELATEYALAFLEGLQSVGVQGCGKHFPGHGDTTEDSHLALPKVEKTEEQLWDCELKPFIAAVAARIPMLMTAHVLYPALDAEFPATLSEKILTGLLRDRLGFEGLIISDDFFMQGIAAHWGLGEAAERFLRAGGDLVLLCHEEARQYKVFEHLVQISMQDSEFYRFLRLKLRRVERFREQLWREIQKNELARMQAKHRQLFQVPDIDFSI